MDLHDGAIQSLYGVGLKLETCIEELQDEPPHIRHLSTAPSRSSIALPGRSGATFLTYAQMNWNARPGRVLVRAPARALGKHPGVHGPEHPG